MKFAATFGICLVIILLLDLVWLTITGDSLYRPAMGMLMRAKPDLAPAVGFYVIYVLALSYLAIWPVVFAKSDGSYSIGGLTLRAGLLGLAAFATYDMTGLSVINGFPLTISLIDMAWGTFAAIAAANLTGFLIRALGLNRA